MKYELSASLKKMMRRITWTVDQPISWLLACKEVMLPHHQSLGHRLMAPKVNQLQCEVCFIVSSGGFQV